MTTVSAAEILPTIVLGNVNWGGTTVIEAGSVSALTFAVYEPSEVNAVKTAVNGPAGLVTVTTNTNVSPLTISIGRLDTLGDNVKFAFDNVIDCKTPTAAGSNESRNVTVTLIEADPVDETVPKFTTEGESVNVGPVGITSHRRYVHSTAFGTIRPLHVNPRFILKMIDPHACRRIPCLRNREPIRQVIDIIAERSNHSRERTARGRR